MLKLLHCFLNLFSNGPIQLGKRSNCLFAHQYNPRLFSFIYRFVSINFLLLFFFFFFLFFLGKIFLNTSTFITPKPLSPLSEEFEGIPKFKTIRSRSIFQKGQNRRLSMLLLIKRKKARRISRKRNNPHLPPPNVPF